MKDMYLDYKLERENKSAIKHPWGFAVYSTEADIFYVEDIFVKLKYRKTSLGKKLTDEAFVLAKKNGYKKFLGSIVPSAKSANESMRLMLKYGFSLLSSKENIIYLVKDII